MVETGEGRSYTFNRLVEGFFVIDFEEWIKLRPGLHEYHVLVFDPNLVEEGAAQLAPLFLSGRLPSPRYIFQTAPDMLEPEIV